MKNVELDETLDNTNAFLDKTLTSLDLNLDMEKLYTIMDDEDIKKDFKYQVELTNLRNENYKKYNQIDITKYENLPHEFEEVKYEILKLYNAIEVGNILTDDYENSKNNEAILKNIYLRISRLNNMVESYVNELTKNNDDRQKSFSRAYFNSLDTSDRVKHELISKYNDLVLESSSISQDIYKELDIQYKRKQYIDEIINLLNVGIEEKNKLYIKDKLQPINSIINMQINKIHSEIQYLEDIMPNDSKYIEEFEEFKKFFRKLIAYDDTSYDNSRQIFEILTNDDNLKNSILNFEQLFINERDSRKKELEFIYEKVGIKNITNSLNYINANYLNILSDDDIKTLNYVQDSLHNNKYDITKLKNDLYGIVDKIWKNQITDIYSYDSKKDFCFICSNNQFIDEKYQTILITNKEIQQVNNYEDYQIGFICNYDHNIMYITENDDIMSVSGNDMSELKTPAQIEQEFINFKVCNRIALNGYKTKILAVYFIDDGNKEKYMKSVELANMYKLPLIIIKKEL